MLTKALMIKQLAAMGVACTMGVVGSEPIKKTVRHAIHRSHKPIKAVKPHRRPIAQPAPAAIIPYCAPAPVLLPTTPVFGSPDTPLGTLPRSGGGGSGFASGFIGGGGGFIGGGGGAGGTPGNPGTPGTTPPTTNPPGSIVPEPATWVGMTMGFGAIGYVTRRARTVLA
jgi:uncharacterized membrane protein YgcG